MKIIRKIQLRSQLKPASYYAGMEDGDVTFTPNLYKAAAIPEEFVETVVVHLNMLGDDAGFQVEAIEEGVH